MLRKIKLLTKLVSFADKVAAILSKDKDTLIEFKEWLRDGRRILPEVDTLLGEIAELL